MMARRLFGFMTIMALIAIAFGLWLWLGFHDTGRWLMVKLVFVLALLAFHASCRALLMRIQRDAPMPPAWVLRVMNESALLIVVPIILLAVMKPF
jgi:putative membrane protein